MKKYDVVYGENYTDRNGEEQVRWKNVGAVVTTQKGQALLLDRTFSPAGCANKDGRGTVLLNLFEPKKRDSHGDGWDGRDSSGNEVGPPSNTGMQMPPTNPKDDLPF